MSNTITLLPHMPEWKILNADFTRLLNKHYRQAYREKGVIIQKHINNQYAIYPETFYKRVESMIYDKTIDFCFIGQKNIEIQDIARKWSDDFATKRFGPQSYLQYTGEKSTYVRKGDFDYTNLTKEFIPRDANDDMCTYFDEHYFEVMKKSNFCLCPAGDAPWSMRFLEAIMCKTIPIVNEKYETWRSYAEAKLDYKFYYANAPEFVYRDDWVEHNYAIFLKYHTLEYFNTPRCVHKYQ